MMQGLTPRVFWAHCDEILAAPRAEIDKLVADLVTASALVEKADSTRTSLEIRSTRVCLTLAAVVPLPPPIPYSTRIVIYASATLPTITTTVYDTETQCATVKVRTGKQGHETFFIEMTGLLKLGGAALRVSLIQGTVDVVVLSSEQSEEANELGLAVVLCLLGESASRFPLSTLTR